MNESEVKKLETEVLEGIPDAPQIELTWMQEQLQAVLEQRQVLAAQFRMWKHMRNDQRMKGTAEQLREIRGVIEYLENEIEVLKVKVASQVVTAKPV